MTHKSTTLHRVESVSGLLRLLDRLKMEGEAVVFRGQSGDWPLIPDVGRKPFLFQGMSYDDWADFEEDLLSSFKKYAPPYVSIEPKNDWDWLFSARHHGLPTRLLDWSSSALKGLYFAVDNYRYDNRDAVLWILETAGWRSSLERVDRRTEKDLLLVYPRHIHPRIVAQDGCFTISPFPKPHKKFKRADKERLVRRAVKVVVPVQRRVQIRTELAALGISHRTMFPGLDGAVASIRQEFGEGWLLDPIVRT